MTREVEPATDVASRLRKFRKKHNGGMTQKELSDALKIDQQRLSGYEMGARIPHTVIAGLMEMDLNPEWLLFGRGRMRREGKAADEIRRLDLRLAGSAPEQFARQADGSLGDFFVLPLYADEAAAGEPMEMRDTEVEGPAIIHRNWCPHPEETDYVRIAATGTSMEPTIPAGAMVTIDRAENDPEALLDKVVAIGLAGDGVTVKRLRRTERGGYIGVPDNSAPEHRVIHLEEGDRIIGKVSTVHAWLG
jgi:phage repressor protein C with HTH and peptisase S24 domain